MTRRNIFVVWFAMLALAVAGLTVSARQQTAAPVREEPCGSCAADLPITRGLLTFFQGGKKEKPPAPVSTQRGHAGVESCFDCHEKGIKVRTIGGIKIDSMKEQWVLYKEFSIWEKDDKHVQAYAVLLNDRSKAMGKLLGVADVHRDQRCLACHTGFPLALMPVEKETLVNDKDLADKLDFKFGVSCEGCHGSAADGDGNIRGWYSPHLKPFNHPFDKNPWRFLSPDTKRDDFGFLDVRSPTSKTKVCVSCHIGDVEQGRIVTHDMYAAGHPPLPGFEIETFVKQMPQHWKEFSDKTPDVQDLFIKFTKDPLYKDGAYKKGSLQRTRSLLAGALAVSSEYLRYVGQMTDDAVKSPIKRPDWPELAVFDCAACHHDLRSPAWRQMRKPPVGVPGRPVLLDWPFALARIALKAEGGEVDGKLAEVRKALGAQPFGNPKDLAKPAQTAAGWFLAKSQDLQKKPVLAEDGVPLLKDLAASGASDLHDYDSARQLVWALQVVTGDLKGSYPNAAKVTPILKSMDETFVLDMRHSRTGTDAEATLQGGKLATREVDLAKVLPYASRYDPTRFQERCKEIVGLLK